MHVAMADEAVRIGPAASQQSYLRGDTILKVQHVLFGGIVTRAGIPTNFRAGLGYGFSPPEEKTTGLIRGFQIRILVHKLSD